MRNVLDCKTKLPIVVHSTEIEYFIVINQKRLSALAK